MEQRRARWRAIVQAAEASGIPVRRYCQANHIDEGQFYHWLHRLALEDRAGLHLGKAASSAVEASFALVRTTPATVAPGETESSALELALESGWRLRIPRGVDESTLRTVLRVLTVRG